MKFKLIIFDMDGTLYHLDDVISSTYQMQVKFLASNLQMSETEAEAILAKNDIYPVMKNESKSATELFIRMGLNIDRWSRYRNDHFDVEAIDDSKAVDDCIIDNFAEICPLVLLSSNSFSCIKKVLKRIGVSTTHFSDIVCSDRFLVGEMFNKKRAMQLLSENFSVPYYEILSIGDRYKTDIQPIIELGGYGVQVSAPDSLQFLLTDLKEDNLHSCPYYVLYS